MIMVNGQHIKKYYGAKLVLEDVTFEVHEGERVGLVGRNGSGKSTLISLIAKLSKPDEGQLTIRKDTKIGYLAQIPAAWDDGTVYDVLASGYAELLACKAQMTKLEQEMSDSGTGEKRLEQLLREYSVLQERFQNEGGYELDAKIDAVTTGLLIPREMYERRYGTLSGGEKTKIGLAAQLISKPELLLLDEPTNHLDLQGVQWLESFLNGYDGSCLIVSHDRMFLDQVVTKIIDIEDGEAVTYHSNYSGYVKEKEAQLLQQFAEYQEQQKVIKKMKETIKQLQEWGRVGGNEKFFRRAASMQKALDRMERVKRPVLDPKGAEFQLQLADRSGKRVVEFQGISKSYGDRKLMHEVNGMLLYGEKIMLLGPNGAGKTTLFKLILGTEGQDSGTIDIGARVDIGYLAQQQYPADDKKNVLAYFREAAGMEEGEARSHLARYLFTQGEVFKSVSQLSGGEWTRLRLALLILKKPNLLLLDEPTNHMDIASREALEDALEEFPGTILAISHDRYFINRLANKVWELDRAKLTVYLGAYDEYAEKRKQLRTDESAQPAMVKEAAPVKRNQAAANLHAAVSSKQPNTERLEQQISQFEARLVEMDAELNEKSEQFAVDELAQRWREREQVQEQLNELYTKWMAP
ncbi:ribosomal protection-like ABC-F family protein [Paenibacillus lignilyticus]|uniref:ATP-binding cassette domain-containing protein n=1 Tax=Paenibacillus lignilyticus TaxID=1172615 RepID=A0ABS5C895_9BACL|nr:ATP-binding cassette domain-containing protein [Paenibacillus lignilyticus]MBP3962197.1 ATP-binding cassette domain-containing protein [Paenibacillus lignilyticus]